MNLFDWLFKRKTPHSYQQPIADAVHETVASETVTVGKEDAEGEDTSTGGLQSPEDRRDVPYAALVGAGSSDDLPKKVEVDISKLPVEHQRKLGACGGHAAQKYKQLLDLRETGEVIKLSPRFLYALAKAMDGVPGEGTYMRIIAKILLDVGCATEKSVPNDTTLDHETYVYHRDKKNLPAGSMEDAAPFKIGGFAFVDPKSTYELKKAVMRDGGGILLLRLGKEWYTDKNGKTTWSAKGIIPLRAPLSGIISGHFVWVWKVEDVVEKGKTRTKVFVFNSWSAEWGEKGTAWFYHDEYAPYLNEMVTFTDIPNHIKEAVKKMPEAKDFKHVFDTDIKEGDRGEHVTALQTLLMFTGDFSRELYAELLRTNELGFYKAKGVTSRAVLLFQLRQNVADLDELCALKGSSFGARSRQAANALITSGALTK